MQETLRNEMAEKMVNDLLAMDFPKIPLPASGPRIKKSGNRTRRVSITRKYGSGGEGIEHKKLKEWVAQNPGSIGLAKVKRTDLEYGFPSARAYFLFGRLH